MRQAIIWLFLFGIVVFTITNILAEGEPKVYTSYKEVKEIVYKTGRPIIAVFVKSGDTAFMGSSASLLSDKLFSKIIEYFVLLKVEFVEGGEGGKLKIANAENSELSNKVLPKEGGKIPTFAIVAPDDKVLKMVPQADPKTLRPTLPQEMANIVKQLKPLSTADEKKFTDIWKDAEKALEKKDIEKAIENFEKISKSGKHCGYVEDAKKKIEELKNKKEESAAPPETPSDSEQAKQPKESEKEKLAIIDTDFGKIVVKLSPKDAPNACERFTKLASEGFYKNSGFHRVKKGSLILGGFPNNDPTKEPDEGIDGEFKKTTHKEGTFGMWPMTSNGKKVNCEFYITLKESPDLDASAVVIGQVIDGIFVAKAIADVKTINETPVDRITIKDIKIEERETKK